MKRWLTISVMFWVAVSADSEPGDRLFLRDGSVLTGSIISETPGAYRTQVPGKSYPILTNVPSSSVRYVLYGSSDKAMRALDMNSRLVALPVKEKGSVQFLPTESFGEEIIKAAQGATNRIWILAYYISGSRTPTIRKFYDALGEKAKAGVDVRLIAEFGNGTPMPIRNDSLNFAHALQEGGIHVGFIQEYRVLHKKVIIVDRKIVFIGSSNLTAAGVTFSDEMNVKVESEAFARQAEADFLKLHHRAKTTEELKF